jgi:hypothetical protein
MKKNVFFLVITCLAFFNSYSQAIYRDAAWEIEELKEINGTHIKRLQGENSSAKITNIGYQTNHQLVQDLKKRKSEGRVTGDRYQKDLQKINDYAGGGIIQLFITRESEEAADTRWFSAVVKDKKGNTVYKNDFSVLKAKEIDGADGWRNEVVMYCKSEFFLPVTIEITDKYKGENTIYIFEVEQPKKK